MTPDQQSASRLARQLAHDLASASDLAHDLASDLAYSRDLAHDLDLASAHARHLAHDLASDPASASDLDHARDLASDLAHARHLAHARNLDHDLDFGRHLVCALDLARDLDHASDSADSLMQSVDQLVRLGRGERSVPPGARSRKGVRADLAAPSACRLAAVAAWLLPAGKRARYSKEYRSELHDLAAAGAGRRQQLGHAVRLLVRAVPLRLAVLAPRREKASP